MKTARNFAFALLVVAWFGLHAKPARAVDRGCVGEDFYGESAPAGPIFCGGTDTCCGDTWDNDKYDTLEAFCEPYGEVNWDESDWSAELSIDHECDGFVIHCACSPQ